MKNIRNKIARKGEVVKERFNPRSAAFYSARVKLDGVYYWWWEMYDAEQSCIHSSITSDDYSVNEYKKYRFKDLFKIGNDKLPHAVFNMGSAKDCPALELGECLVSNECYAWRDENMYKLPLPYRRRQAAWWYNAGIMQIAEDIKEEMDKKDVKILRINESGDFQDAWDVMTLNTLSMLLGYYGIKVYTYTSRRSIDWSSIDRKHVTIIGSSIAGLDGMFIMSNDAKEDARKARQAGFKSIVCPADCNKCDVCPTMKEYPLIVYAQNHK